MQTIAIHCSPRDQPIWERLVNSSIYRILFIQKGFTGDADWYIDALYEEEGDAFPAVLNKSILTNTVVTASTFLRANQFRYNGWAGFWEKGKFELAGNKDLFNTRLGAFFETNKWQYHFSSDTPGMVGPRVVAMIINEAYFGLAERISSKSDIDTAMKLGTNYPFGPFEWAEKIGISYILDLLNILSKENDRYTPAPLVIEESIAFDPSASSG